MTTVTEIRRADATRGVRADDPAQQGWRPMTLQQRARDRTISDRLTTDVAFGQRVCAEIDKLDDFKGIGVLFKSLYGRSERVRPPQQPNDLTLVLTFGTPSRPPETEREQRLNQELRNATLQCLSAGIAWAGTVKGVFLSGTPAAPLGWWILSYNLFAAGTGSVACLMSGVRVVNAWGGSDEGAARNAAMDNSRAYQYANGMLDGSGVLGPVAGAYTLGRAGYGAGSAGARAAAGAMGRMAGAARSIALNEEVRWEVVNAVGTAMGVAASYYGGLINEFYVKPREAAAQAAAAQAANAPAAVAARERRGGAAANPGAAADAPVAAARDQGGGGEGDAPATPSVLRAIVGGRVVQYEMPLIAVELANAV